jgi:mono/diheme cytochrome c family protein
MVAVVIIAVVFSTIAGTIFWAAPRGRLDGFTNAMLSQSKLARRAISSFLAVIYIGFGIVIPVVFLFHNHNKAATEIAGVHLSTAQIAGQTLFGQHCGFCHTLAAANAVGKVGPNLDQLRPSQALVETTLANGCTSADCLGFGTMPADIVSGQQAKDVAEFVAAVAGH